MNKTDVVKLLSNIKAATYETIVLFVLSLITPGTLIMFYFYRNYFELYDSARLLLIIVSLSSVCLIVSKVCLDMATSSFLQTIPDDELAEVSASFVSLAPRWTLMSIATALLICYLFKWDNITCVILYLITNVILWILLKLYFYSLSNEEDEPEEKDTSPAIPGMPKT